MREDVPPADLTDADNAALHDEGPPLDDRAPMPEIHAEIRHPLPGPRSSPHRPTSVTFTCGHCGCCEERTITDRPTMLAEVYQGVREEIRLAMLLDQPNKTVNPPPYDLEAETGLAAAAVLGLRWKGDEIVERKHFLDPFRGWTWEICREHPGRPELSVIAAAFEKRGLGRAADVEASLRTLAGPFTVVQCDPHTVRRVLDLARQRDLLYDAHALVGLLSQDVGMNAIELRERVREMFTKLKDAVAK